MSNWFIEGVWSPSPERPPYSGDDVLCERRHLALVREIDALLNDDAAAV